MSVMLLLTSVAESQPEPRAQRGRVMIDLRLGRTCLTAALAFVIGVTSAGQGPPPAGRQDVRPAGPRAWPLFGGSPGRNLVNPFERGIPAEWDVAPEQRRNVKWVAQLGRMTFAGPVVAGGRVFIGTNNMHPRDPKDVDAKGRPLDRGVLMCFRESDGAFLWQASHARLPQGRIHDWPAYGIRSMPAVSGDRLYYVSNRCELICADVADGKPHWTLDMIGQLGVYPHNWSVCSPVVVDELVFVITGNGVGSDHTDIPAPTAPSFLCVNRRNGKVIWQDNSPTARLVGLNVPPAQRQAILAQLRNNGELLLHGQWSSPSYAIALGQPQVIFPGGDGWLRAFEPATGKLLWKFDCNPKAAAAGLGGGERSDFLAAPVIHGGRLYIGVGQDPAHENGVGHLWCIDLARATQFGRDNPGHDVSPVGNNFDPRALMNQTSALAWHFGGPAAPAVQKKTGRRHVFGRTLSSCAVHDGLCYAADIGGLLYCLDAYTGQLYWDHDCDAAIQSAPFWVDGKVYLGTDGAEVLVFAHGKVKDLLATMDMHGRVRGVPTAVNGVLFVPTESRLYAIAAGP